MSELKIPDAAYQAVVDQVDNYITHAQGCSAARVGLEKAAPLLVAAELRRLADVWAHSDDEWPVEELLDRADELDPQGVTK